jgi:hypothetical protein
LQKRNRFAGNDGSGLKPSRPKDRPRSLKIAHR